MSSDTIERIRWLFAGFFFGVIFVSVALFVIACVSASPGGGAGGWKIMQSGLTIVQTPCALVYIEVRSNDERTMFYWRIAVVPVTRPLPLKPEPKQES